MVAAGRQLILRWIYWIYCAAKGPLQDEMRDLSVQKLSRDAGTPIGLVPDETALEVRVVTRFRCVGGTNMAAQPVQIRRHNP